MTGGADVPLSAGLWADAGLILFAAILWVAARPLLRRKEHGMACSTPGSLGRHPLGEAGEDGVRRCACGMVSAHPAEPPRRLTLVARTDTAELQFPPDRVAHSRAVAAGHPSVWEPPTTEIPRPRLAWPPR